MSLAQAEFRSAASRIELENQPTDLSFSPCEPQLAVGDIDGSVHILPCLPVQETHLEVDSDLDTELEHDFAEKAVLKPPLYYTSGDRVQCGKKTLAPVRSVLYNDDGSAITTAHSNGNLYLFDAATGKRIRSVKQAHGCEIYRLANIDHHSVASGDDTGLIKVWDVRSRKEVGEIKAHVDYITDLACIADRHQLIASSGDTSITINDMRKLKTFLQSHDGFKEEGTSLQLIGRTNEVACGTSSGRLAIFSPMSLHKTHAWFTGGTKVHRGSIDAMVMFDQQTVITGCADGVIRVLRFDPNRVLGVIGRHKQPDTVERLAVNSDVSLLASIGLDHCIRLWDIQNLKILTGTDNPVSEDDHPGKREKPALSNKARKKLKKKQTIPNFFSDLKQP